MALDFNLLKTEPCLFLLEPSMSNELLNTSPFEPASVFLPPSKVSLAGFLEVLQPPAVLDAFFSNSYFCVT